MTAWKNWSREVVHEHLPIYTPGNLAQLQEMVRHAAEHYSRVRCIGPGHSWRQLGADGAIVLTHQLDRILSLDPVGGTVTVEGGAVLRDLAQSLFEQGHSLMTMGDTDRQSIAGAVSTDTHGSGATLHGLAEYVTGMTLVKADGTLHEVTDDELPAARVSVGRLGAIYSLTIRVRETLWLDHVRDTIEIEDEKDHLDDLLADNLHLEYWYFPYTDLADRIRRTVRGPVDPIPDYSDENEKLRENGIRLNDIGVRRPSALPLALKIAAGVRRLQVERRKGPAHHILPLVANSTVDVLKTHTMECLLPIERLWDGFAALKASIQWARDRDVFISVPVHIRFVKKSTSLLSPYKHDLNASFSINFSRNYRGAHVWFPNFEDRIRDLGGEAHLGKISYHPTPIPAEFEQIRQQLDPDGVFDNPPIVYPTPASEDPL